MPHSLVLFASASLADPIGSSPLTAAVLWLQHTLLGTVATTVAIIAVGWVGFMTLSGRINIRHGATVILGCFILFGATSIATGMRSAAGEGRSQDFAATPETAPIVIPPRAAPHYDPYAGASVPTRRSPN